MKSVWHEKKCILRSTWCCLYIIDKHDALVSVCHVLYCVEYVQRLGVKVVYSLRTFKICFSIRLDITFIADFYVIELWWWSLLLLNCYCNCSSALIVLKAGLQLTFILERGVEHTRLRVCKWNRKIDGCKDMNSTDQTVLST